MHRMILTVSNFKTSFQLDSRGTLNNGWDIKMQRMRRIVRGEESAFQQTEREKKRYGNGRAPPPRHGADGASDAVWVLLKPWCELLNALLYGS